MDPWRSLAIAMQESSLKPGPYKTPIMVFTDKCHEGVCKKQFDIIEGYTDLGIFQFHINSVMYYNLDPVRIMSDMDYAIDSHFKILKNKMKVCSRLGPESWTCYHSKTRSRRKLYKNLVNRYYKSPVKNIKKKPKPVTHLAKTKTPAQSNKSSKKPA